jgi:hypothetical protein
MNINKRVTILDDHFSTVREISSGENDFITELHHKKRSAGMTTLFGEEMSKKTANTADARQKRSS